VTIEPEEFEARLRRGLAAFSEGDFDATAALMADDIELVRPGGLGTLRGVATLRQWMEPDALEGMTIEAVDIQVAGDKALVKQRTTARGAGSGIELDLVSWGIWTIRPDGLLARIEVFQDYEKEQALEAWGG
jgi:ketosteroid isomerase-like protein